MKIKIKQEILMEKLNIVSKAISTKNLIPVLSGIKFSVTSEGLELLSNNHEITIRTQIEKSRIEEVEEGSIVIPNKIIDIVRKSSGILNIEVLDGFKIYITNLNDEYVINGIDSNEFPTLDLNLSKNPIMISNDNFKNIVTSCAFATSSDENKEIHMGINFVFNDNEIICNATDSHRLARKIIQTENISYENINFIIHSRDLIELVKLMGDENLETHLFENKIIFKTNEFLFQTRLISGKYPDTSSLIASEFLVELKIKLTDIFNAIDKASLLSNDLNKNVVKLEIEDQAIISSNIPEIGHVEVKLNLEKVKGNNISIAFNAKYMLDALKVMSDEYILLKVPENMKSFLVTNENDTSVTQVVGLYVTS